MNDLAKSCQVTVVDNFKLSKIKKMTTATCSMIVKMTIILLDFDKNP